MINESFPMIPSNIERTVGKCYAQLTKDIIKDVKDWIRTIPKTERRVEFQTLMQKLDKRYPEADWLKGVYYEAQKEL